MTKAKGIGLLILFASLALFAYQNWNYPTPPIHFLIFTFPPVPYSFIIYSCLLIGFVVGWVAHARKIRRTGKNVPARFPGSS
jgi:cell division protein FtsX